MKLVGYGMKLWENVIECRIRDGIRIANNHFSFVLWITPEAIFL